MGEGSSAVSPHSGGSLLTTASAVARPAKARTTRMTRPRLISASDCSSVRASDCSAMSTTTAPIGAGCIVSRLSLPRRGQGWKPSRGHWRCVGLRRASRLLSTTQNTIGMKGRSRDSARTSTLRASIRMPSLPLLRRSSTGRRGPEKSSLRQSKIDISRQPSVANTSDDGPKSGEWDSREVRMHAVGNVCAGQSAQ
jgi:hypothetical protein